MKEMIGIYKFTNRYNRKVYVGQSVDIERRIKGHFSEARKKNPTSHLHRAINKYGADAFDMDVLIECPKENLNYWEKFYIKYYCSNNIKYGYNMTIGGQTPVVDRESTNNKISNSLKGITRSVETRKKLSDSHKGKPTWNKGKKGCFNEETINKFIEKRKGVLNPSGMKGKHYSEEARKNMGRKKGSIPWNKGLTKDTDERIANQNYKPWNKGKHLNKLTKKYED